MKYSITVTEQIISMEIEAEDELTAIEMFREHLHDWADDTPLHVEEMKPA